MDRALRCLPGWDRTEYGPMTCHGRWMAPEGAPGLASVIVPTYNRARVVTHAMDSVFAQTHRPVELIVVDDGSTDGTEAAVESWQRDLPTDGGFAVHYLRRENRGAPAARNLGAIESRGEYVQFLDSDDMIGPDKIRRQIGALQGASEHTVSYGGRRHFAPREDDIAIYARPDMESCPDPLGRALAGPIAPTSTWLWRRGDVVQNGPWDESLLAGQDDDYGVRFLLRGGCMAFCPEAWSYCGLGHEGGQSVSAGATREVARSRMAEAERIESALSDHDLLATYRDAVALRWFWLAQRYVRTHGDLSAVCFRNFRRLSTTGLLPEGRAASALCRLLGFPLYWRLRRLRAKTLHGEVREPIGVVASCRDVFMFDHARERTEDADSHRH